MKNFYFAFFAFISVFALQSASAQLQYANAGDDEEVLYAAWSKNGNAPLFERTDSDEVKIRKVLAYCDSQRKRTSLTNGSSPCVKTRSVRETMEVTNANSSSLRNNVYRKYLKMKPGFGGQITFFVTIAASGEVTDISIKSSTTDYPEFDNAIKDSVAAWKWKPVKKWRLELVEHNGDYTGMVSLRFKEEQLK